MHASLVKVSEPVMVPERVRKEPSLAQRSSGEQPWNDQPEAVRSAKVSPGAWVELGMATVEVEVALTVTVLRVVAGMGMPSEGMTTRVTLMHSRLTSMTGLEC